MLISGCCGAPEHEYIEDMCSMCLDWAGFETDEEDSEHDREADGKLDKVQDS